MVDSTNLIKLVSEIKPDEIYNLAAQSHVAVSFETPEYTGEADALGVLKILEAVRMSNLTDKKNFIRLQHQNFTDLYKKYSERNHTILPKKSIWCCKTLWILITKNYREAYNMFACNGILFNHESPLRGETFVTRKITIGLSKIINGTEDFLLLGNLNSKRDWGHAKDYVEGMWLMLQQDKPDDYVLATNKQYSIKEFIEICLDYCGCEISWSGEDENEVGTISKGSKKFKNLEQGKEIIKVNKSYYRPAEVDTLLGDFSKAKKDLGWEPKHDIYQLATEMMESDIKLHHDI